MKQLILRILRKIHLLNGIDHLRFLYMRWSNHTKRKQFAEAHPGVALPPDAIIYETYGKLDYEKYYVNGRETATELISLFKNHTDINGLRIGEWGCGSARVLRHMRDILDDRTVLVGTDLDAGMIEWNKRHLPGIRFIKNNLLPPIGIEDSYFDIVYSISVMTHLSADIQRAWLKECMRILNDHGYFIFSVHGDSFIDYLSKDEKNEYLACGYVFRGNCGEGSKNQVSYTSPAYVRNVLAKDFTVVSFLPGNYREQDFWVVQKTAGEGS